MNKTAQYLFSLSWFALAGYALTRGVMFLVSAQQNANS